MDSLRSTSEFTRLIAGERAMCAHATHAHDGFADHERHSGPRLKPDSQQILRVGIRTLPCMLSLQGSTAASSCYATRGHMIRYRSPAFGHATKCFACLVCFLQHEVKGDFRNALDGRLRRLCFLGFVNWFRGMREWKSRRTHSDSTSPPPC